MFALFEPAVVSHCFCVATRRWRSLMRSSRPTAPSSTPCSHSSTSACLTTAASACACRCSQWCVDHKAFPLCFFHEICRVGPDVVRAPPAAPLFLSEPVHGSLHSAVPSVRLFIWWNRVTGQGWGVSSHRGWCVLVSKRQRLGPATLRHCKTTRKDRTCCLHI